MKLRLKGISLPLAPFVLTVDVELRGRITAILGPSGAGKTSLLELITGLRRPVAGLIQIDDQVLTDAEKSIFIPPRHRAIGYVPQDLALFPHLSVRQNLLYGKKADEKPNSLFSLEHATEVLELNPFIGRGINALSGGEKQRVALARALLSSPRLLLLDEPLGCLDLSIKRRILPYLARVRDEFQVSILYVTHDLYEVLAICDDAVWLHMGQIAEHAPPASILRNS